MEDAGELIAGDLYPQKAALIQKGAERLGLFSIRAVTADASVFSPQMGLFDRVLCDVPCSGFGIIRRKPEIRYKDLDTLRDLPAVQYKILETAAQYVKEGGQLVYSTCTLNRHENDYVVQRFLKEHPMFTLEILPEETLCFLGLEKAFGATLMPHRNGTGWFFLYAFFSQGMISEKIAEGGRTGGKGGYQVNDAAKAGGFLHRAGTGKIPRRTNFSVDTPKAGNSFEQMTNLPADLRKKLDQTCEIPGISIRRKLVSQIDGTIKYLYEFSDGETVESVLMQYEHGYSLCISTQVGCRMGCRFCASTLMGWNVR